LPRIPTNIEKQPDYSPLNPYKNYSKEMMYSYLKKIKIDTLPGIISEYSNFGVALLGVILEEAYQRPLEDLIKSYVTEPAKMSNTKFNLSTIEKTKMATGYNEKDGTEATNWDLGAFIAAGGIKSNLDDMVKYLQANMNEINADFKLSHQQTFKGSNISMGLNWILTYKDGQTWIWHNGGTSGFTSYCGYIKEQKVGVVLLNNSGVNVDNIATNILKEMNNEKQ
jgi:CubicO group peptidase (beta-lactamase class C family)